MEWEESCIEVAVEMETPSSLGRSLIGCKYVQESVKDTYFNDSCGMWCVALEWEESRIFLITEAAVMETLFL
jgi:hypothetical protein